VWIRSEATVAVHRVHAGQNSVGIVEYRAAAPTSGDVTDDVTTLIEQPQAGEIALAVGVGACVVARLVVGGYDDAEVGAGQSVDQAG